MLQERNRAIVQRSVEYMLGVMLRGEEPSFCSTLDGQCFPEHLKPVFETLKKQLGSRDALIFVTGMEAERALAQVQEG